MSDAIDKLINILDTIIENRINDKESQSSSETGYYTNLTYKEDLARQLVDAIKEVMKEDR